MDTTIYELLRGQPRILKHYIYAREDKYFEDFTAEHLKALVEFFKYYEKETLLSITEFSDIDFIEESEVEKFVISSDSKTLQLVKIKALNEFFEYAKEEKHIDYNPCSKLFNEMTAILDNQNAYEFLLTKGEIKTFLNHVNKMKEEFDTRCCYLKERMLYRDVCIFALVGIVGLRQKELIDLKFKDVDMETSTITINGKYSREVKFGTNVREFLEDYLSVRDNLGVLFADDIEHFFFKRGGSQLDSQSFRKMFNEYSTGIDKTVTCDILWQSCVNLVYQTIDELKLTAKYFGCKTSEIEEYVKVGKKPDGELTIALDNILE